MSKNNLPAYLFFACLQPVRFSLKFVLGNMMMTNRDTDGHSFAGEKSTAFYWYIFGNDGTYLQIYQEVTILNHVMKPLFPQKS